MKWILTCLILMGSLHAKVLKTEKIANLNMTKFIFDNHTYIHLHNRWNSAGDASWHDPDCEYCQKKIEDRLEKHLKDIQGKK